MMHDDAPGWESGGTAQGRAGAKGSCGKSEAVGPVCWKCLGAGSFKKKSKVPRVVTAPALDGGQKKRKRTELRLAECTVCNGRGRILKKRKEALSLTQPGRVAQRHAREPPEGYKIPGSKPLATKAELLPGEELCSLVGHWRIYQRRGGHRWSTDDLVTAWTAGRAVEDYSLDVNAYLDLGCGIGSVLQMVAWQLPVARCTGIEAQELSASMAKRSLDYNLGTSTERQRCKVILGDMRDASLMNEKFDLVTGTPPYFKVEFNASGAARAKTGGLPSCKQSAPARYEFRGGIESYCAAASRWMKKNGIFIVCEGLGEQSNYQRVTNGAQEAGLTILKSVLVHGREDKPPLFGVYVMCHNSCKLYKTLESPIDLDVRTVAGERTAEYKKLMLQMGIVP